jgi:hypothetical protein
MNAIITDEMYWNAHKTNENDQRIAKELNKCLRSKDYDYPEAQKELLTEIRYHLGFQLPEECLSIIKSYLLLPRDLFQLKCDLFKVSPRYLLVYYTKIGGVLEDAYTPYQGSGAKSKVPLTHLDNGYSHTQLVHMCYKKIVTHPEISDRLQEFQHHMIEDAKKPKLDLEENILEPRLEMVIDTAIYYLFGKSDSMFDKNVDTDEFSIDIAIKVQFLIGMSYNGQRKGFKPIMTKMRKTNRVGVNGYTRMYTKLKSDFDRIDWEAEILRHINKTIAENSRGGSYENLLNELRVLDIQSIRQGNTKYINSLITSENPLIIGTFHSHDFTISKKMIEDCY